MEWSVANTPDTKFRIGSLTKQFTAALALMLVQEGKLELDAPLSRYLPDFPRRISDKVTITQLMNHTSGIPGYTELPGRAEWLQTRTRPGDFIKKLHDVEFLFPPGTAFSYNNSGYFLLGYVIETVTGKSYEQMLREKIFRPLGMSNSGFDSPVVVLSKRADGYESTFDGYRNVGPVEMTVPYAAGALYSTAEDLYKWDEALHGESLLTNAMKEKMFSPGLENYGFGFYIRTNNGRTSIEHDGTFVGFRSFLRRYPDTKRLVVLLNNTDAASLSAMSDAIVEVLDGRKAKLPKPPAGPLLRKTYDSAGIGEVIKQVREWAATADPPVSVGLDQLLRVNGYILSRGRAQDALTLARYMSETNPQSETAAVTHARVAKAAGFRVEALKAYGRALEVSRTPRQFPSLIPEMQQVLVAPQ
jgi:CubicO group peptidase (beta-lactamase class C family)